jgi:hypothetical protein
MILVTELKYKGISKKMDRHKSFHNKFSRPIQPRENLYSTNTTYYVPPYNDFEPCLKYSLLTGHYIVVVILALALNYKLSYVLNFT